MRRVILVHGWEDNSNSHFWPWFKKELIERGVEVISPDMPDTNTPVIEVWVEALRHAVGNPTKDTYFVGHSIGCQTIMRYLETLETPVGGAVFIAGWFKLANLETPDIEKIAEPWLTRPINFEQLKQVLPELKVFLSSNELFGYVRENKKLFEEKLGADVVILENKGHFTTGDGVTEIPEALITLMEMMQ